MSVPDGDIEYKDGEPHGWIQWKGTDVCIDLHCKCGHHGHYDGDFLYAFECPACHAKYAVGANVKLIELDAEGVVYYGDGIKTCELDTEDLTDAEIKAFDGSNGIIPAGLF